METNEVESRQFMVFICKLWFYSNKMIFFRDLLTVYFSFVLSYVILCTLRYTACCSKASIS